jgi:hypothetical protein
MTFDSLLHDLDFIYDAQAGSYFQEDHQQNLHTYAHIRNNQWLYEKYDTNDQVISTIPFYTYD